MKIKSLRDFLSGLMFIVIGVVFTVGATHYTMGTAAAPGAGFFPLILSVLLSVLGAVVLFKSLTIETEGGDPIGAIAWRPLLAILGAIVVFGLGIKPLGLMVSVPLLVLIASLAADFKWQSVLVSAVALTLLSWGGFVLWMKLAIPLWPTLFWPASL